MEILKIAISILIIMAILAIGAYMRKNGDLLRIAMNGIAFSAGMLVIGILIVVLTN